MVGQTQEPEMAYSNVM